MKYIDQQDVGAHNNGHYYYVANAYVDVKQKPQFRFLHLSNAIKFAKNKTIPCVIYNQAGILIIEQSKIHEF